MRITVVLVSLQGSSEDTHQMLVVGIILITVKFEEISISFSTLTFHGPLPRFTLYTKMAQCNIKLGTKGKTVEMPWMLKFVMVMGEGGTVSPTKERGGREDRQKVEI